MRTEFSAVNVMPITRFNAFLLSVLILFWGSSFVVVKIALGEGLTPIAVATFRFLIAGAFFLFALLFDKVKRREHRVLVEKRDVPTIIVLALTGVTVFFMAQYTGIQMAGASIAAIFVCLLSPILIAGFSAILFKESLGKRRIVGICIAGLGTFTVIVEGTLNVSGSPTFFYGSLILLSTPFLWATYTLLGKKILGRYNPFLIVTYVNALGGLFLTPFSLLEGSFPKILSMSSAEWLAILFLSFTCSFLGYYIWFYSINHVGAAVASSFLFAEPLITAIFAITFVGEKLSIYILAGGLLIFLGVYTIAKK